jgi:hypothetical protein
MTTVPYLDMPEYSNPHMQQLKFEASAQGPPPAIIPQGGPNVCYDPVSFNQETAMLYNNGQPQQQVQPTSFGAWC